MSNLEDKAVELLDKLEELTVSLAPEALDVAASVVRVDGIGTIAVSAILLLAIVLTVSPAKSLAIRMKEKHDDDRCGMWDLWLVLSAIAYLTPVIIFGVYSVVGLLDVWNWVAIFEPKLALANKLING